MTDDERRDLTQEERVARVLRRRPRDTQVPPFSVIEARLQRRPPLPLILSAGVAVVLLAVVVGSALAERRGTVGAPATPTPPAPTSTVTVVQSPEPTATPPATPTPTPTPTPPASPTVATATRYVSAAMGYSIELRSPWRRANCGSSTSGPLEGRDGVELFIAIPDRDLVLWDVGGAATDNIEVYALANPTGLSPREWERSKGTTGIAASGVQDVTFAGRPAVLVGGGEIEVFLVASGGYMYQVSHLPRTQASSAAERGAIVRSFSFLSAEEARAARPSPTPTPAPRSAEQVADTLAQGLASRDVATLARVISTRCFSQGPYQGGPSSIPAERYLETLRDRFARGLMVDVRPRPITGQYTFAIRSTWREPGQPDREVDLLITADGSTAYWIGAITDVPPRP